MKFFNTGVIFIPIVVILFKNGTEAQGAGGYEF